MSEIDHELCRYLLRDEAVRAAEDAAAVPSIQHRDLPEAVAALTERVARLEAAQATLGTGDVFADVECGSTADEIARLTAERDAAIRERDAALSAAGITHGVFPELYELRAERERLRGRVAELEAAAGTAGGDDAVVVPQTVVAGNFAQIHWNTCCRLHRMAMDKAGVRWTQSTEPSRPESEEAGNAGGEQEPPRGWLTAEERELIAGLTDDDHYTDKAQNIAKALLARETPPMVRRPKYQNYSFLDCQWIAAIRAAGVKVEG